jgi:S-methylmethionine-dependent homocysteine/selenocysteine methylase
MMSRRNKYLLAGVNCTHPDYIEEILYLFQDYLSKDRYQVVYPNRGDVWDHL